MVTEQMAYSIDKQKLFNNAVRTAHFLLYLAAVIVFMIHQSGWVTSQQGQDLMLRLAGLFSSLGYGLGVVWSPPRRPWTNEERVANGLPPLAPSVLPRADGDVKSAPPAPPPPVRPG